MFTNRTALVRTNPPLLHYGAAVCDADGDGRFEFVVAGYGGPNRILAFQDGYLDDVGDRAFADVGRQALGVAAADIPASSSRGAETFFDGKVFDPENPKAYLDSLAIKATA